MQEKRGTARRGSRGGGDFSSAGCEASSPRGNGSRSALKFSFYDAAEPFRVQAGVRGRARHGGQRPTSFRGVGGARRRSQRPPDDAVRIVFAPESVFAEK